MATLDEYIKEMASDDLEYAKRLADEAGIDFDFSEYETENETEEESEEES